MGDNPFLHINGAALAAYLSVSVALPVLSSLVLPIVLIKKHKRSWAFYWSVTNVGMSIATASLTFGLWTVQLLFQYRMSQFAEFINSLLLFGAVVTVILSGVMLVITGVLWLIEKPKPKTKPAAE